jgi:ABC-type branched-subunit amino acid transport system permease subunit
MQFSWRGVIVAPLLMPAIFSGLMAVGFDNNNPWLAFLFVLVLGCIVSYGSAIFLLLPSLYLLSLSRPLTGLNVCLLGFGLGAAVFVPITLMEWKASGPDSGPPTENPFVFLLRFAADPTTAIYPVAGLVTAALYWWLATWRRSRVAPEQPR